MNTRLIPILMIVLLALGCTSEGQIDAELTKDVIDSGETTTLEISGKNTGSKAITAILKVSANDETKVKIAYEGILEFKLQPGEDTGKRILTVLGVSDHLETKYRINATLIDKEKNKVLDEKIMQLTVKGE